MKILYSSLLIIFFTSGFSFGQPLKRSFKCAMSENFENRELGPGCGNTVVTGPPANSSGPILGISHGTPRIEIGCTHVDSNDPDPQGLLLVSQFGGECGEGFWLEMDFDAQKSYIISFSAYLKNPANSKLSNYRLNIRAANNIINNGNGCDMCYGFPDNSTLFETISSVSHAQFGDQSNDCQSIELDEYFPSQNFNKIWFSPENIGSGNDILGIVIDNICITEICPDCLIFNDPVADIPPGTHDTPSCIETFTNTGFIQNDPNQITEFIAGDYIHFKPNTHPTAINNGYFHAYLSDRGCNKTILFNDENVTNSLIGNSSSLSDYDPEEINFIQKKERSEINFTLYPNPNNGQFTMLAKGHQLNFQDDEIQLEIFNNMGQKIFSKKIESPQELIDLTSDPLPVGIYFLLIKNRSQLIHSQKILMH